MRKPVVLIFGVFLLMSCSKVETAPEVTRINSEKMPMASPTVETNLLLKAVKPDIKLNAKQQKYLDESLPPDVREVLEKAEKFEVLAEVRKEVENDGERMTFEPNRIAKIISETDKKEILEAFYQDASKEDSPASCYEPHHAIRGTYNGKAVEVEICFSCSRFVVKSEFGKFDGTIVRENRKSEDLFNRIIESKSIEMK